MVATKIIVGLIVRRDGVTQLKDQGMMAFGYRAPITVNAAMSGIVVELVLFKHRSGTFLSHQTMEI